MALRNTHTLTHTHTHTHTHTQAGRQAVTHLRNVPADSIDDRGVVGGGRMGWGEGVAVVAANRRAGRMALAAPSACLPAETCTPHPPAPPPGTTHPGRTPCRGVVGGGRGWGVGVKKRPFRTEFFPSRVAKTNAPNEPSIFFFLVGWFSSVCVCVCVCVYSLVDWLAAAE